MTGGLNEPEASPRSPAGLYVLHAGLATTVQDQGRPGRRGFGVPEGGAFDRSSFRLANALVGNTADAAALELTIAAGSYLATETLALAIAGAEVEAKIEWADGRVADRFLTPRSFTLVRASRLVLGRMRGGARAYLAVAGGFQTPVVLGARSSEDRIKAGDFLAAASARIAGMRPAGLLFPGPLQGPLRLLDGPDSRCPRALLDSAYGVSASSDRRGIRLEGVRLEGFERPGKPSAPVAPGAIQVAGGLPIILGVAGGTMGGYPHVAHVISADLDRLAQARPGDRLRFASVDLAEARRLDVARLDALTARDRRVRLIAREALGSVDSPSR
jgi:biotin-dependent carboxylase-like uncharacterized protein